MEEKTNRSAQIIRTSIIGIAANVLLAAFKAVVGILASSVAIVMDAVNNLSDALSSVARQSCVCRRGARYLRPQRAGIQSSVDRRTKNSTAQYGD